MSIPASSSEEKSIASTTDMEVDPPVSSSIKDWVESCNTNPRKKLHACAYEFLHDATVASGSYAGQTMKVRDIESVIELADHLRDMSKYESSSHQDKLPWLGMMSNSISLAKEKIAMVDMNIAPTPDGDLEDMFRKHYRKPKRSSRMSLPMKQVDVAFDFRREFSGQGARYLQRHLHVVGATYDFGYHYARVVPVIQSSGAGKFKTVVELAKLELGFFVCVRDPPGEQVVSEPPRDEQVIPWLMMAKSNINEREDRYQTLAIWLESLAIELVSFYRCHD
jgi:hypothetical protein